MKTKPPNFRDHELAEAGTTLRSPVATTSAPPQANASDADPPPGATISNADLAKKLQERQAAKGRRDFGASDAIRAELETMHGIKCARSYCAPSALLLCSYCGTRPASVFAF